MGSTSRIIRTAAVAAISATALLAGTAGVAQAEETVSVSGTPVYAAPSFQAEILGRMTGSATVSCETTDDNGSNAGGVVMLQVRGLGLGGGVGYIVAPLGRRHDLPFC